MSSKRLIASLLVVFSPLLLAATCSTKVTGGGSLEGADGRATIALTANSCGDATKGQFQYVDQAAGVKMHGDVVAVQQCVAGLTDCQCQDLSFGFGLGANDSQVDASYRSTNPAAPGEGHVVACIRDNGQGANSVPDAASVHVLDGPFVGYAHDGVLKGNFQQHKCPGKTTGP